MIEGNFEAENDEAKLVFDDVLSYINKHGLNRRNRKREIVYKRFFLCHILHKKLNLTSQFVGDIFNQDHATVLHACKKHEELMSVNDVLYRNISANVCEDLYLDALIQIEMPKKNELLTITMTPDVKAALVTHMLNNNISTKTGAVKQLILHGRLD